MCLNSLITFCEMIKVESIFSILIVSTVLKNSFKIKDHKLNCCQVKVFDGRATDRLLGQVIESPGIEIYR